MLWCVCKTGSVVCFQMDAGFYQGLLKAPLMIIRDPTQMRDEAPNRLFPNMSLKSHDINVSKPEMSVSCR